MQAVAFLDVFLDQRAENDYRLRRLFITDFDRHESPLSTISDHTLIAWCDLAPDRRYPLVAGAIKPFTASEDGNTLVWKPLVHTLFERAPLLGAVLEELSDCIRPRTWSGSLAGILEKRVGLFASLFDHDNDEIAAWACNRHAETREAIAYEREHEERRNRDAFESFE